jgi:folate-dependent phosphoribosylglycinamide formyltransferase PurN
VLGEAGANLICLAGYLRLLPTEVLEAFPGRVLNIHPALLPRHGGKGMYGMRVHEAVLASGDKETGASVHFVTERYDEGGVILQRRCNVEPGDTPETLAARVLREEHLAYVEAIRKVLNDA